MTSHQLANFSLWLITTAIIAAGIAYSMLDHILDRALW